jgi:hypothetical protein
MVAGPCCATTKVRLATDETGHDPTNHADEDLLHYRIGVLHQRRRHLFCCGNRTSVISQQKSALVMMVVPMRQVPPVYVPQYARDELGGRRGTTSPRSTKLGGDKERHRHKLCLRPWCQKNNNRDKNKHSHCTRLTPSRTMTFLDVDGASVDPTKSTSIQQRLVGPIGLHHILVGTQLDWCDGGRSWRNH